MPQQSLTVTSWSLLYWTASYDAVEEDLFSSSSNVGYIQLVFSDAVSLDSLAVVDAYAGTGTIDATLETADSSVGCEYTIYSDGWLYQSTSDYCWGDSSYDPFWNDTASLVNVRLSGAGTGVHSMYISEFYSIAK